MKNRYVNRARLSEAKFRELLRFFALDLTAVQITKLTGLNRNTVNRYLNEIRRKIELHSSLHAPAILRHQQEKMEDPEGGFVILAKEMDGKIYTRLAERIEQESATNSRENVYDMWIDLRTDTHHFFNLNGDSPAELRAKRNRIESFWAATRLRLAKFKGIHSSTFHYHLKECEFRYNHRDQDLYPLLLAILRNHPLF